MRFSVLTPPRDSRPRRQRNADQLHHLIIPATTATPTAPPTTVGNAAAPLAWDPGVRHPLRQRRTYPTVPLALPPPSPSPPLLSPTAEDARTQHRHRGPPGSFRLSFSEDADTDVGAGDGEGGTDDEHEDADDRPAFVSGPRHHFSRPSAREVAPRFSHPHNLRAHPSGASPTRIAAQTVRRSTFCAPRLPTHGTFPPYR